MNKSLLMIGLGLVLALPSPRVQAQSAGTVQLTGHVPEMVRHMPSLGHLAATNLNLAIGLPLRNREWLTNLLQQISDPASTNYHKYLSPSQFADQFGPSEQDYEAVANFARQNGLAVTQAHGNRLLLDVAGLSTDIEKAFQVSFKRYQHPTEAREFFATDVEPTVPAALPILDISGLNNYSSPKSFLKFKPTTVSSNGVPISPGQVKPATGSGPGGNFMGNDFRNAYVPGSTLNGSGQKVALVQFDGYFSSDITQYESMVGRTNVPLKNVLLDGFNGAPTGNGGEVEVSLDIEMAISMAPALAQVILYEGNPYNFFPNDVLNRIATDDAANQISCSWGWSGGPKASTDQIFQQMALQGQTFFTASGDSCTYPVGTVDNPNYDVYPADSVYVASVGATTLTMTPGGGARVSETVWNWGIEYGDDGVGSSGGISTYYTIPYWQTNVNMTASQGSTTHRNFPDLACTGDNVLVIADGGVLYLGTGGTSCASPLWAGFASLVNQQETNNNRAPVGFLNPALYALANSAKYTNYLNDITTGNNTWSGSPLLFYAVSNYDLCTGLGTPGGTNLINVLTAAGTTNVPYSFQLSAPPQPYGTTMAAMNGGTPNGEWTLFIQDIGSFNTGMISNGWSVTVTLGSPVGAVADLDLTMTNSATSVGLGSNVTFYIGVTNYGLSLATNVIVEDTLPDGSSLVASNLSTGTLTRSGSQVNWAVGNLAIGAGASLALTVQAPTNTGTIFNYAIAQSDTPIVNTADNSALSYVYVGAAVIPQLVASYSSTNGGFSLNISGSTNSLTTIYASTNLQTWVPIYTNVAPFTFTDPNTTNYHYRFYRAQTGP